MPVAITGNTYPVRRELRDMGGEWDAGRKAWMVPDDKAETARSLVGGAARPERYAPRSHGRRYGSSYTRFSSGHEVYTNRRGRCEDAPCCGCCS